MTTSGRFELLSPNLWDKTELAHSPTAPPLADTPPSERQDRRDGERREPHEVKAELRLAVAGFAMTLVNLSSTGLLAETNQRLCPGRAVDIFLRDGGVRKVLRATVVRAWMHALAPQPVFRAALHFERTLAFDESNDTNLGDNDR